MIDSQIIGERGWENDFDAAKIHKVKVIHVARRKWNVFLRHGVSLVVDVNHCSAVDHTVGGRQSIGVHGICGTPLQKLRCPPITWTELVWTPHNFPTLILCVEHICFYCLKCTNSTKCVQLNFGESH